MVEEERLVEAIEEGKIVRVPENYARREDLPILRRVDIEFSSSSRFKAKKEENVGVYGVDEFRRPLKWKENRVVQELVDNFHWEIVRERRRRDLTRKQFAELIGEDENILKKVENGILPSDDFILINKIQSTLGINLRKDGYDSEESARGAIKNVSEKKEEDVVIEDIDKKIFSDEIELIDD